MRFTTEQGAGRYPGDVFGVWPVLRLSGLTGHLPAFDWKLSDAQPVTSLRVSDSPRRPCSVAAAYDSQAAPLRKCDRSSDEFGPCFLTRGVAICALCSEAQRFGFPVFLTWWQAIREKARPCWLIWCRLFPDLAQPLSAEWRFACLRRRPGFRYSRCRLADFASWPSP